MYTYQTLPSLREHVRVKGEKDNCALEAAALQWTKVAEENRLAYDI